MEITYRILKPQEYSTVFKQIVIDKTLWAFNPSIIDFTEEKWYTYCSDMKILSLGIFCNGSLGGILQGWGFTENSRVMEIAAIAFRDFVKYAIEGMRGAVHWCFDNIDCACLLARIPTQNRHVINILTKTGFEKQGIIPELFWDNKRQKFVNGRIWICTPANLQSTENKIEV